jgi:hypothetical protein
VISGRCGERFLELGQEACLFLPVTIHLLRCRVHPLCESENLCFRVAGWRHPPSIARPAFVADVEEPPLLREVDAIVFVVLAGEEKLGRLLELLPGLDIEPYLAAQSAVRAGARKVIQRQLER